MKRFRPRSLRINNRQNILILHDMFVLIVMITWKPVAKTACECTRLPGKVLQRRRNHPRARSNQHGNT
jgi:hypothetical protein